MKRIIVKVDAVKRNKGNVDVKVADLGNVSSYYVREATSICTEVLKNKVDCVMASNVDGSNCDPSGKEGC